MFIMPVFKCHTLRSLIFTSDAFTDDSNYYSNQSPSQFDAFCQDTINSSQFCSKLQVILRPINKEDFLEMCVWCDTVYSVCAVLMFLGTCHIHLFYFWHWWKRIHLRLNVWILIWMHCMYHIQTIIKSSKYVNICVLFRE